jgi:hypothetical protein
MPNQVGHDGQTGYVLLVLYEVVRKINLPFTKKTTLQLKWFLFYID